MCEFCENIVDIQIENEFDTAVAKGTDFIFKDAVWHHLYINTGDSGCPGVMDIYYCPLCGRELDTNDDDVSIENKKKFVQIMRQLTAKRKE